MARLPDLIAFAQEHGLKIGAIADLIHYRNQTESLVERVAERLIQTVYGAFRLVAYRDKRASETHLALVKGEIIADRETLVRVHEPLRVMDFLDVTGGGHSWPIIGALERIAESPVRGDRAVAPPGNRRCVAAPHQPGAGRQPQV